MIESASQSEHFRGAIFPASLTGELCSYIDATDWLIENEDTRLMHELRHRAKGKVFLNYDCRSGAEAFMGVSSISSEPGLE